MQAETGRGVEEMTDSLLYLDLTLVKCCNGLLRELVEFPFQKVFKRYVDLAIGNIA